MKKIVSFSCVEMSAGFLLFSDRWASFFIYKNYGKLFDIDI